MQEFSPECKDDNFLEILRKEKRLSEEGRKIKRWEISGLNDRSPFAGFFPGVHIVMDPETQNSFIKVSSWSSQEQQEPEGKYKLCPGKHPGANTEELSSVAKSSVRDQADSRTEPRVGITRAGGKGDPRQLLWIGLAGPQYFSVGHCPNGACVSLWMSWP